MDPPVRCTHVSDQIKGLVKSGDIWVALLHNTRDTVKVRFGLSESRLYHPSAFFHPVLSHNVEGAHMLLLFPDDKYIIDTARTSSTRLISERINAHLGKDPTLVQMVLCIGDMRYKIRGIPPGSRLYLRWASTLCIYEKVGETTLFKKQWGDVPLLAITNGRFKELAMFPVFGLHTDRCFVAMTNLRYVFRRNYVMYPLDVKPNEADPERVPLSTHDVLDIVERDVVPHHELVKYEVCATLSSDRSPMGTPSLSSADHETRTGGDDDSDDDDGDSSVSIYTGDFHTPRHVQLTAAARRKQTEQAVLDHFFDGDADDDTPSTPGAATAIIIDDFDPAHAAEPPLSTNPSVRFVEPQDGASRRAVKSSTVKE